MSEAIVVALIGAGGAVLAAVTAAVLTRGRNATTRPPDPALEDQVEVHGDGYWRDAGRDWKVPVTGTISRTHLTLDWEEVYPGSDMWRAHLEGKSDDGVTFNGRYSYPSRDAEIRTFSLEVRKHPSAKTITLLGTWRNPNPKTGGEDTWRFELTPKVR